VCRTMPGISIVNKVNTFYYVIDVVVVVVGVLISP
jgi:hypothetical protein